MQEALIERLAARRSDVLETADGIVSLLRAGHTQGRIAALIGYSPGLVSQYRTIAHADSRVRLLVPAGRVRSRRVLHGLAVLYRRFPRYVSRWIVSDGGRIEFKDVTRLQQEMAALDVDVPEEVGIGAQVGESAAGARPGESAPEPTWASLRDRGYTGTVDGRPVRLVWCEVEICASGERELIPGSRYVADSFIFPLNDSFIFPLDPIWADLDT